MKHACYYYQLACVCYYYPRLLILTAWLEQEKPHMLGKL
jgi:hypothetical protein